MRSKGLSLEGGLAFRWWRRLPRQRGRDRRFDGVFRIQRQALAPGHRGQGEPLELTAKPATLAVSDVIQVFGL
jgi:hypothetical protein